MNKRRIGILVLLLLSLVAVLYFLHFYNIAPIPKAILQAAHWLFIASLILFAIARRSLTTWILVSMVIGIGIGLDFPAFAQNLRFLSQIFLRMVKTIIAPILFATLVVGIAGHSNLKQVGRMGWKSILYFEIVTTLALAIGLIAINISQAGVGITIPEGFNQELPETKPQSWQEVILHIFPENFVKSVYNGDVLPIVVFSVIFGISLALLTEEKRKPLLKFSESLAETMFKFTNIIMHFAPFGVGAAIAVTVGHLGIGVLASLLKLLITLYVALFVFLVVVLFTIASIIRIPIKQFIKAISEPVSIAFATTSSESALPIAMENMEKFGVPRKIVSFVLPTGYTFNLDGTTLYLSLASVFVAQAAGIHMSIGQQAMMGLTLMLTSKGVAGVPRASLVILLGTAASFGLPLWPIMAILGIDELMDMARTSVNVIGNTLASCVIARWEGEFDDEKAMAFKAD
ncbi:cation:dicarboxylase symporter family transporter [Pseudoflavitalea sp. X16]|uniref:dicarboxylate/amino acid:cation symporter n=1 Tax=Paraflavitalea devenefica TaxID=2716334 RepID=UPI00141F5BB6|nr:cation:dicarboxylase symporter family transporter [Paraflavitalea devenefica]NII27447.1 cation:dicarboxylase symporter family transporter [Paraflavitalea devenefica]